MKIAIFDTYERARDEAIRYRDGAKKHTGMRGVEYRVYCYHGAYHLWRGRCLSDFPDVESGYVFSISV